MSDVDKAVCVKPYIFKKSFYQTHQLFVKTKWAGITERSIWYQNVTINRYSNKVQDNTLFRRQQTSGKPRSLCSGQVDQSIFDSPKRSGGHWAESCWLKCASMSTVMLRHSRPSTEDPNSSGFDIRGQGKACGIWLISLQSNWLSSTLFGSLS